MIVLQDSREQKPLKFSDVHTCTLQTGDYSIAAETKDKYTDQDLDFLLCIERKSNVSELFTNVTQKRFRNVIERMDQYKYKFLLLEFHFDDVLRFPYGTNIPKRRWKYLRVKPPFVISCLSRYMIENNIQVIYAGDTSNAKYIANSIMERVWQTHF